MADLPNSPVPDVHVQSRTAHGSVGWLESLHEELDNRFASEQRLRDSQRAADKELAAERDRRYTEVGVARQMALQIKEEADKTALGLARDIQTYKDEQANDLRSQIERERSDYPTRAELVSLSEKLAAQSVATTDLVSDAVKQWDARHTEIVSAVAALSERVAVGPSALQQLQQRIAADSGELRGRSDQTNNTYRLLGLIIAALTVIATLAIATHGFIN